MRLIRRLIAWSFFVALLVAVGIAVFHLVRYQPRFTVAESHEFPHLSADGRWLLTVETDIDAMIAGNFDARTRLHVFDTRSAQRTRSYDVGAALRCMPQAPIGTDALMGNRSQQRYVAYARGQHIGLIDWQTGAESTFDIGPGEEPSNFTFSQSGRWLTVQTFVRDTEQGSSVLIDLAECRIVRRLQAFVLGIVSDEQLAVCCKDRKKIEFVDLQSGETMATIEPEIDMCDSRAFVRSKPEGRWIALGHARFPEEFSTITDFEIWDSCTRRRVFQACRPDAWSPEYLGAVFPVHGGTAAAWMKDGAEFQICILGTANAVRRATIAVPEPFADDIRGSRIDPRQCARFSSDGALFLVDTTIRTKSHAAVFDTQSGQLLWNRTGFSFGSFLGKSRLVAGYDGSGKGLLVLDADTGRERPTLMADLTLVSLTSSTPDGRLIVLVSCDAGKRASHFWDRWLEKAWPQRLADPLCMLAIAEPATGREILRLRDAGGHAILSDDGSTLMTWPGFQLPPPGVRPQCSVQIWDVHPHRAWFWAITWSLAVGAALLLLRRWRLNRKAAA